MTEVTLFTVPKTLTATHYPEVKAIVARFISFSSPELRAASERGFAECARLGVLSWIVDLTGNPGVPSQADLAWIENAAVEMIKRKGVRAVMNVHGASAIASMGPKRWNKSASEGGLSTYDCESLADALNLAAEVAAGRAA
jgi:hypothetical protein